MQNSTSHWQTQTFSNEIMFTKDQNFGTLAIPQDIEILGWYPARPVLPHGVTLIVIVSQKRLMGKMFYINQLPHFFLLGWLKLNLLLFLD